jgi:uncharacterized protein (DUF2147 family)
LMTGIRVAAFLLGCLAAGTANAATSTVNGTWRIRDLVLHIYDCKSWVCGRIVWLEDPSRRRRDCGKLIVWGLAATGPHRWSGGTILDPDDDEVYQLSAVFQPNGMLHAQIYKGLPFLGQTEILRRVDFRSLTHPC